MKPTFLILTYLIVPSLTGCKDSAAQAVNPKNNPEAKLQLSTDELLQLMGGELYEIIAPDDIKPDDFAGLGILRSDGSIQSFSGSNNWKPGEVAKVVCFPANKNTFEWAISRNGNFGKGASSRFPITKDYSFSDKHRGLSFGEQLIRFSIDESITLSDSPQDDDFDIIFHVLKK